MPVDLEAIRKKYHEVKLASSKSGGVTYMTLKAGDNLVRFLCPENSDEWYKEAGFHYFRNEGTTKVITCLRLTTGDKCYVCDLVAELKRSGNKKDVELAKSWSAKSRIFFNILDREDGNVKVLGTGTSIFKEILKYFADPDWGDLTHPETGRDVVINRSGSGMETEYSVTPKPKTRPLGVPIEDLNMYDLNSLVSIPSYDEQKESFEGTPPKSKESVSVEETSEGKALIEQLDFDDPLVKRDFQKWKKSDNTLKGLKDLVDKHTAPLIDTEDEEEDEEDRSISSEVEKALSRMKNRK